MSLCRARRRSQEAGTCHSRVFWAGFGAVRSCHALYEQVRGGNCLCRNIQHGLGTASHQGIFQRVFQRIPSSLLSLSPLLQSGHEWFGERWKASLHRSPKAVCVNHILWPLKRSTQMKTFAQVAVLASVHYLFHIKLCGEWLYFCFFFKLWFFGCNSCFLCLVNVQTGHLFFGFQIPLLAQTHCSLDIFTFI